jgi:SPX domain protein involved in polyphosphate accumulation
VVLHLAKPDMTKSASGRGQEDELAQHALWARRFATVNATGLRKIAKKHDKYARNDAGKQFVRVRPFSMS